MIADWRIVAALRVFLVLLLGLLVMLQTVSLPGQFAHMAAESADFAPYRWPATLIAGFWVLCAEVIVVCTWRLLTRVARGRIFRTDSLPWVDTILGAAGAAWAVLIGLTGWVLVGADDPGMPLLLISTSVAVTTLGLVLLVMRTLLRQATTLHDEMEGVI